MNFVGGKTSALLQRHKTCWQDGDYDTLAKTSKQFGYVANCAQDKSQILGRISMTSPPGRRGLSHILSSPLYFARITSRTCVVQMQIFDLRIGKKLLDVRFEL